MTMPMHSVDGELTLRDGFVYVLWRGAALGQLMPDELRVPGCRPVKFRRAVTVTSAGLAWGNEMQIVRTIPQDYDGDWGFDMNRRQHMLMQSRDDAIAQWLREHQAEG